MVGACVPNKQTLGLSKCPVVRDGRRRPVGVLGDGRRDAGRDPQRGGRAEDTGTISSCLGSLSAHRGVRGRSQNRSVCLMSSWESRIKCPPVL